MIRQPTSPSEIYRRHKLALAGEVDHEHWDDPFAGWFQTRLIKGGPWVPARSYLRQSVDPDTGELLEPEELVCEVRGKVRDINRWWGRLMTTPISRQAYEAMLEAIERAGSEDPTNPILNPTQPIDLRRAPVCPTTR